MLREKKKEIIQGITFGILPIPIFYITAYLAMFIFNRNDSIISLWSIFMVIAELSTATRYFVERKKKYGLVSMIVTTLLIGRLILGAI